MEIKDESEHQEWDPRDKSDIEIQRLCFTRFRYSKICSGRKIGSFYGLSSARMATEGEPGLVL